jgi:hypothetical protein
MTYSIQPIMKVGPNKNKKIVISEKLWIDTWLGLRARGQGRVESAAIWGGKRDDTTEVVEAIYFLDDYADSVQFPGYHQVSTKSLATLFERLRQERRLIIGDVHTHPTSWVGLSKLDKEHPIEFRCGLYAIVLPSFALPSPSLSLAGVHVYEGDGQWRSLSQSSKELVFSFIPL